ncbi:SHOCT domain-containing protein [Streptacidiphilus sp. 4-A2]|nr:SHOCT domain-containing protein [Streptacidiphilus sp. 4-A2]
MRYYGHGRHLGGWVWIFPGITMVLFWAVLLALIVLLWRMVARHSRQVPGRSGGQLGWGPPPGPGAQPGAGTPEQVLADRLARGEIDTDEYQRRLDALHGGRPPA